MGPPPSVTFCFDSLCFVLGPAFFFMACFKISLRVAMEGRDPQPHHWNKPETEEENSQIHKCLILL